MKNYLLTLFLCIFLLPLQAQNIHFKVDEKRLINTVEILTSDSLAGRLAGSGYDLKVARFLEKELLNMGYVPLLGSSGIVEFKFVDSDNVTIKSYNVVMILKSKKSTKNILIGAHHDHLGIIDGVIYRGANDNASGVASLMEIARNIQKNKSQFKTNVIIAAFGAEENKISGSRELVTQFKEHSIKIDFMFNLEMTGAMNKKNEIELLCSDSFDLNKYLAKVKNKDSLLITTQEALYHISDQYNFVDSCPVVTFATTAIYYYHHPKDDISEINFLGMKKLTDYVLNFIKAISGDLL